jgi:alkanesulfonate monooxygenase SsuD/methylene tetrahydromethanopterin reductase-like flavin-dependent oxidoreductase (luciferase family)
MPEDDRVKFSIAVNMERYDPGTDMRDVVAHTLALVQLAEQGGFEIAWAAEHHTIELLVAPNPFTLLTHWAAHTSRIRLGTAVVVAPYWHPIRAAGEAALFDLLSGGRLELGISRGAFQYEFDRMAGGIPQQQGVAHVKEMLPAILALWRGDYEHRGALWRFPQATSVPKPLQKPHPPIWVAARDAGTFELAIEHGAHIMATPLSRPHAEVAILGQRFRDTLAKFPGRERPRFLMLRRACVYANREDWRVPVEASIQYARRFETLFRNIGGVENGFPVPTDLAQLGDRDDFRPEAIRDAMVFGTPEEVVAKLKSYEAAGVDQFCYGANFGLPPAVARRSLELFIAEVMPHFAESAHRATARPAHATV